MIDTQTMVDFPVFADSGQHIKPADAKYSGGFLPADTLPAQYANWLWYKTSKAVTELNKGVESIEEELNSILTAAGITPSEATNDQVKTAVLQWIADAKNLTNATNTLAVSHGGTGSTSAQGAFNALANGMNESKAAPDETDYLITTSTEQDKTNWRRKNFSYLWVWIKSKIAGITDSTPTASSNNLITSGGTKTALDTKPDKPNFVTLAQYNAKTSAERAGKYWIITDATGVDVPLIQDDTKSTTTVWSSTKTDNQINGALANYTKNNNIAKGIASPGWYRLCEIATGVSGAIIELEITTMYYNSETSSKKIIVSIGWTNHNIEVISCSDNKKITTQLRLNVKGTSSERKATIDVYYAMNQNNSVYTKINCKQATVTLKSYEAITEEVTGLIADITATSLSGALGDYSKCEKFTPKTTPTTGAGSKTFTWELPINAKSIKQVHIAIGGSNNIDEILILEFSKIYVTNITEIKKSSNITYSYDAQILTVTTSNAFWGDYSAKIITIA